MKFLFDRVFRFLVMLLLAPLAFAGYLTLCYIGFFGRAKRGRAGVRALDHFVNASLFNGIAWESLSSHAWRKRDRWWGRIVIWITDRFQPGHTQRANRREQTIIDLVTRTGIDPNLGAKLTPLSAQNRKEDLANHLLTNEGEIKLCWAAGGAETGGFANLGDGLSAFMIANLAGKPIRPVGFTAESVKLFGVGSIGHMAKRGHAVIWGTGCYRPDILTQNVHDTTYEVLAVRGNTSRKSLEAVGIKAPACYGEPVWLLPSMFHEKVEKKYELGIICHISDLKETGPDAPLKDIWSSFQIPEAYQSSVVLLNTWHPPTLTGMLDKLRLIRSCKRIASRSFHGMVIAEAYGIPCLPICSNPGVPGGAFPSDQADHALLDKRALEFLLCGKRSPHFFYGQRRNRPMDWEKLMQTIDRVWTPLGYDAAPMLESFPFDIPVDPISNLLQIHPSLNKQRF